MVKSSQQKESTILDSEKDLDNTTGENSDEENCHNSLSLETTSSEINNRSNVTDLGDEHESIVSKIEEEDLEGKDEEESLEKEIEPSRMTTKESDEEETTRSTKSSPQKRKIENDNESSEEAEECVFAKRQKSNIIR